ncbi:MAG: ferrous iron transport protein B [Desulfurococcaceae archaeon]
MVTKRVTVAIIGQPNVGKSTLFNVLAKQHVIVTNWPGKTVERYEARIKYKDHEIILVDLPGIYGFSYLTLEERISRDYVLNERPDVVVVLVDSLSPERTMYLAVELLEMRRNVVLAFTKVDEAHSRGVHINFELLERELEVPVVPVSAVKKIGIDYLLEAIVRASRSSKKPLVVDYGELNPFIDEVVASAQKAAANLKYPLRWAAIKFLEGDTGVEGELESLGDTYGYLEAIRVEAAKRFGASISSLVVKKRFEYIEALARNAIARATIPQHGVSLAKIFYNPYAAPLVSGALLFSVFTAVFAINTGYPLTAILRSLGYNGVAEWLEENSLSNLIGYWLSSLSGAILRTFGETLISRFIVEAIIRGLATLLLFLPLLLIAMVALGALDDSGIVPRIAVGMHALFQKIGLSGHAMFPLIMSLGCNVPGVLITRAVPSATERWRLMLLVPFMPCQARLLVLLAVAGASTSLPGALLVPLAYLTAFSVVVVISLAVSLLSRKRGEATEIELLLELPPLHKPIPKVIWWFAWSNIKHFLAKAGTVILLANIIAWVLTNLNAGMGIASEPSESVAAFISRGLAPILAPLGVSGPNAWFIVFALIMGFIAKELFVSSLIGVSGLYTLRDVFKAVELSPASTVAISLLVTLYVPCLATLIAIYSESKSLKLVIEVALAMLVVAYATSLVIYNAFSLMLQ